MCSGSDCVCVAAACLSVEASVTFFSDKSQIHFRYVVDSGFVKQLNHNPRVGLDILEVVPISK